MIDSESTNNISQEIISSEENKLNSQPNLEEQSKTPEEKPALDIEIQDIFKKDRKLYKSFLDSRNDIYWIKNNAADSQELTKKIFEGDEGDKLWAVFEKINSIKDKETALSLVSKHGLVFKALSEELKLDLDIALAAVNNYGTAYRYFSSEFRNNKEMALACASNPRQTDRTNEVGMINEVPDIFKHDKNFVIDFVSKNGDQLCGILVSNDKKVEKHFNDKEVILAAVINNPKSIRYLKNTKWHNDYDFILSAVKRNGFCLKFWNENARDVGISESDLNKLSQDYCNNEKIVTAAIENEPTTIKFASPRLQKKFKDQ